MKIFRKSLLALAILAIVSVPANAAKKKTVITNDPANMDGFITELMGKMTLQEKIGQLNLLPAGDISTGGVIDTNISNLVSSGSMGAVLNVSDKNKIILLQKMAVEKSRLGIPLLVGLDVIHGYNTIFPIPLGMSCSWDISGIEAGIRVSAEEAGYDGISWTYSPMVDIAPDARWGRIAEGNGEDPYLGGLIAAALVRGYQGDNTYKDRGTLMACLKHFALYGACEGGLDYNYVDMSRFRMYNQFLPPYKAAVEAGVGSVMSSFNIVDNLHATANPWLLTDVLRNQWGFNGFVVTDYASIKEMQTIGYGDLQHNSVKALKAGTDMDMCSQGFLNTLEKSLNEGLVTVADIDKACRRVLEAKYKLGLFADPYRNCGVSDAERSAHTFTPAHRKVARDFTAETFVLLKNENNLLPLKKQGRIALIGPNSDNPDALLGTWVVHRPTGKFHTLKEAMQEAVKGKAEVVCHVGCNFASGRMLKAGKTNYPHLFPEVDNDKAHAEAVELAKTADVIVCAMGEGSDWSGESHSRACLDLADTQMALLKDLAKLGKPIVLLNFSGRPTVLTWEKENIPAIMNVWFGGTEMGDAICDVLFGDKVPCGRLTTSLPKTTGQEPLYYNHVSSSRPVANDYPTFRQYKQNFQDVSNGPLFPFGFGLSYTTFKYGKMEVAQNGREVKVTVPVSNTGNYDGVEVVQCYIRDIAATKVRPVQELKGFERVEIKKGETKNITITLNEQSLSYYNDEGQLIFEPGEFDIMMGSNCQDIQTKRINVQ